MFPLARDFFFILAALRSFVEAPVSFFFVWNAFIVLIFIFAAMGDEQALFRYVLGLQRRPSRCPIAMKLEQ